jgi:hypothetical protein
MKKRINVNFKSYKETKKRFFKKNWAVVLVFMITSCSVQNQMSKDGFENMRKSFSANFYDRSDTITNLYSDRVYTRSLIKDFTNKDNVDYSKPVRITIKDTEMFLDFTDTNKKQQVLKFYGRRHKKRFVFYTNYETISFPILFINKEMERFSVYVSDENELIFQNRSVNEGMLLFFGAGHSSTSNYKFKILKNE